MEDLLKCPFCFREVPYGAVVCTGCRARAEYGTPPAAIIMLIIVAGFFALKVGSATVAWLGWITFAAGLVAGGVVLSRMFAKRVVFKLAN